MPTKSEFVLTEDGLCKRVIQDTPIQVTQDVLEQLSAARTAVSKRVAFVRHWEESLCGISVNGNYTNWTVPLTHLNIRAPMRALADKVFVPMFTASEDPVLTMRWEPLPGMRLIAYVSVNCGGAAHGKFSAENMWLIALDSRGSQYRLPLSNLYDDCRVCTGQDGPSTGDCQVKVVSNMLVTFANSEFRNDLWKDANATHSFFRWKAEKDGFVQLPPANNTEWSGWCMKVALNFSNQIAI